WAHGAMFYGFIVLFAGTVILGFDTDFTSPVFGWSYFHGSFYLIYKETLNLLGTALVLGILVMMVRRAIVRPAKLDYARPDRAAEPAGYGALADFSPLHLLQLDACTKCGKCHQACPANATGRPLSPRDVILELREESNHAAPGVGGVLGSLLDRNVSGDNDGF